MLTKSPRDTVITKNKPTTSQSSQENELAILSTHYKKWQKRDTKNLKACMQLVKIIQQIIVLKNMTVSSKAKQKREDLTWFKIISKHGKIGFYNKLVRSLFLVVHLISNERQKLRRGLTCNNYNKLLVKITLQNYFDNAICSNKLYKNWKTHFFVIVEQLLTE